MRNTTAVVLAGVLFASLAAPVHAEEAQAVTLLPAAHKTDRLETYAVTPADLNPSTSSLASTAGLNPALSTLGLTSTADLPDSDYDFDRFANHVTSIPYDIIGVMGGTLAIGFANWKWGNTDFHFNSEGGFGKNTGSMGMDKLGHAYTAYLLADYFSWRINESGGGYGSEYTGALLSMGIMTTVEIFDGFSTDHGFSWEDMVADAAGAGFSVVRNVVPGLKDKLDFRIEYVPSGNKSGFHPITDYSGQKYLFALKLAGFEALQDTPLRFVELQAGYFARGFTAKEQRNGDKRRREPYVAIGLNLQELLFGRPEKGEHVAKSIGRAFLQYYQPPYTYATYAHGAYDY